MQQSAESVWDNCLDFVRDNIHIQAFKTWFDPIKPIKLNGDALSVEVPSKFFWFYVVLHKQIGHIRWGAHCLIVRYKYACKFFKKKVVFLLNYQKVLCILKSF